MATSKRSTRVKRKRLILIGEVSALSLACLILFAFITSFVDNLHIQNGQEAAVITSVLVDLANSDRAQNGLEPLTVNPTLTAIAQAKANDMAAKGYFSHTSPDGHDPWWWFQQAGYKFTYAGENLAVNFSDSAAVETAWMNSPEHRSNLLSPNYTQVGIATAEGMYEGHQTIFVAQEFGTPAPDQASDQAGQATASAPQANVVNAVVPQNPTIMATASTKPAANTSNNPAGKPEQRLITTSNSTSSIPTAAVLGSSAQGLVVPSPIVFDIFNPKSLINFATASPETTLRYVYYAIGLLIVIAILIQTRIEFKRHHTKHVMLALGLLVLMGGLFFIANAFVFSHPTLAKSGNNQIQGV